MSEIPTPFKILSAITAGTLVGCSVAEAISPIPTEQAKNITGTFELASAEIGDNFWNTQVIYGKLNPLNKEGLTKQDLTCLNIEINKSNFNFCTFESRNGARENWWIKSPEGWIELQKNIKSGYNMDGEIIDVATWVLGNENVIWYPQNQDDWLKDSQNPNFGITFLPPSAFGQNPIQGYDRSSGLGIKIPLIQVENDPFSQENIFQAIAYRTGFQIGGVTPTLVQPTETPTPSPESLLPPEMTEKYLGQFDKWEEGIKEINGVETDVIYGFQGETKKVIAMDIEIDGKMRMTRVGEYTDEAGFSYYTVMGKIGEIDGSMGGRFNVTDATTEKLFKIDPNKNIVNIWNSLASQWGLTPEQARDRVMIDNKGLAKFNVAVGVPTSNASFPSRSYGLPNEVNFNLPVEIITIATRDEFDILPLAIKNLLVYSHDALERSEGRGTIIGGLTWVKPDGQLQIISVGTPVGNWGYLNPEFLQEDVRSGTNKYLKEHIVPQLLLAVDLISNPSSPVPSNGVNAYLSQSSNVFEINGFVNSSSH